MSHTLHERIKMVEKLSGQLHQLLRHSTDILQAEGTHGHARQLASWGENYRDGLHYGTFDTDTTIKRGEAWLAGLSDRLLSESEELSRKELVADLENDGRPEVEDLSSRLVGSSVRRTISLMEPVRPVCRKLAVESGKQPQCGLEI